jgi:nitroimidazol reductase NimA-like FMN-containing flavoprotein (pyridoxamine 5'-phosphate oxidase superfamily)
LRRKDRLVTDEEQIDKILSSCDVCRVAMVDGGAPYVVPMNFGYTLKDSVITLYFHCAGEGRKIDVLKSNPSVCVEMDCGHRLIEAETACGYTMEFESIIGSGRAKFLTEPAEKRFALNQVMKKFSDRNDFTYEDKMLDLVSVFKVTLEEYAGKKLSR